jgi:hemolysin activation/secretion protein
MAGLELSHENTEKLGPPEHSWRERVRPEHGGLQRATVSWFEGKGNSKAVYWTWRGEAQQFLPLWHSRRALALRGFVERQENRGDDPVPFQRLMTNDDPDVFRGYPDERFHDIGIAALTAEYRWPLWVVDNENELGADAYLFADWGQVFAKFDDLGMDRLAKSYGGGVRLGGNGRFVGRIEVGHSEEGTQFRLRADQLFQYEKAGFFNARSPVPDR